MLEELLDARGVIGEVGILCFDLGACPQHDGLDCHRDEEPDLFGPCHWQLLFSFMVLQMLLYDASDLFIVLIELLRDHSVGQESFGEHHMVFRCRLLDFFVL